jgi:mannose-6-phosphate isomerase
VRGDVLKEIYRLKNPVQNYAWGSKNLLSELLGKNPSNSPELTSEPIAEPEAELWMGAHPKAPSQIEIQPGEWKPLDQWIQEDPKDILGVEVAKRFQNELPFLFKILAVEKPLSIQLHPNQDQAKEGFQRENEKGIPLSAPHRNYKDPNHKPELICALTPFQAFVGFRPVEELQTILKVFLNSPLKKEVEDFLENSNEKHLTQLLERAFQLPKEEQAALVNRTLNLSGSEHLSQVESHYPADIGVFIAALMNFIELKPAEALFLGAGEIHAYMSGLGVEVMANSDNVLRGGLTPKHIDVPEMMKILTPKMGKVPPLESEESARIAYCVYPSEAEEFQLWRAHFVEKTPLKRLGSKGGPEIIFTYEGEGLIYDSKTEQKLSFQKGDVFFIPAHSGELELEGGGVFYGVSVRLD